MSETSTEQKIEEILSLLAEVGYQGYIPARLREISKMPEYLSWIDSKNNTIFHYIALFAEKSCPTSKRAFLNVAEMMLESNSQETSKALLQNKNNDGKTPFELTNDAALYNLMNGFPIDKWANEQIDYCLKLTEKEIEEKAFCCSKKLNAWVKEESGQIAIEHNYSKSGDVVEVKSNEEPRSKMYDLRKRTSSIHNSNCNCCNSR